MNALDLYCGAGGATRGLRQAGFRVVGVDLKHQPNYCGDAFVRADALEHLKNADLDRFDFIWASPPCQRFTALKKAPRQRRRAPGSDRPDPRAAQKIRQALLHRKRRRRAIDRPNDFVRLDVWLAGAGRGRLAPTQVV